MAEETDTKATLPPTPETAQEQTTETQPQAEEARFTQKQLNDLIAKEAGTRETKTRNEILEKLGLSSVDDLDKLKARLDSEKTEEQKRAEALESEKKRAEELEGKTKTADLIIELLDLGMDKESAKKYAKFANEEDGETAEAKAQAFIRNNEGFVKKSGGNLGIQSGSKKLNETASALASMKKEFGI